MKTLIKISVVTAMLSLLGTGMYAQFSIGLRGGVNFAKWKWEVKDIEENMNDYQKYMPAPFFALPVEYSLSNSLAIRMEPSYIKQGTRTLLEEEDSYEGGIGKYELDSRMRINYLSLPVMVAGKFSAGKVRFFAMGGPHVGYALNGETKIRETLTVGGESQTTENSEKINWDESILTRFDVGLVFAGGVEIPAGPGAVIVDARYLLGLQNLDKEKDDFFEQKIYNRGIGLSAGYLIPLGK